MAMNDCFTTDEIKALAAEIAERIARDAAAGGVPTLGAVCPPNKLCCFLGYNCNAPFVCPHDFGCPQGFGAGVIGTVI
jgi:hypothetical protein